MFKPAWVVLIIFFVLCLVWPAGVNDAITWFVQVAVPGFWEFIKGLFAKAA